ncbi:MAG: low molecular weight protein arginine phosphatase [Chloroflexi bacterium]|nr:low molecular weight protein arginine phosphatase [Chloroflexota bacterium]
MPSILFVCTANVCRSPMAMALFREKVKASSEAWRVESAGTWASAGDSAARVSQAILLDKGIDLSAHRSRPVSRELLQEFNLILVMEEGHKEALRIEFPEAAGKIYMLSEMIGQVYNIQDPIGMSSSDYKDVASEIEYIFSRGEARILKLAQGQESHGGA